MGNKHENIKLLYEKISKVLNILSQLSTYDKYYKQIIDIHNKLLIFLKYINNPKLKIGIIGSFSSGKSTFINSLLNETICTEKVNPSTSCISIITYKRYLEKTLFSRIYENNKKEEISLKEYQDLVVHNYEEESKAGETKKYKFLVEHNNELLSDLILYDTPGFNNEENSFDEKITYDALKSCDVVFWIQDINKGGIDKTSIETIKTLKNDNELKEIYLIFNKADIKDPTARKKIISNIPEDQKSLFKDIFTYSALKVKENNNEFIQEKNKITDLFKDLHNIKKKIIEKQKKNFKDSLNYVDEKLITLKKQNDIVNKTKYLNNLYESINALNKIILDFFTDEKVNDNQLNLLNENINKLKYYIYINFHTSDYIEKKFKKNNHLKINLSEDITKLKISVPYDKTLEIIGIQQPILNKCYIELDKSKLFIKGVDCENTKIFIKQSNLSIFDCNIYGYDEGAVLEVVGGSKVNIENSQFYNNENEQIKIENNSRAFISKTKIRNSHGSGININDSYSEIKESMIYDNKFGIYAKDSKIKIENCQIQDNHDSQIYGFDSEIILYDSKIKNGKKEGIYVWNDSDKNHPINIINCLIINNRDNGIYLSKIKNFFINNCEICENGNSGNSISQIFITNSSGKIHNSQVYKGVNATGILSENSNIEIAYCKIFENYYNGINFKKSKNFTILKTEIYENGNQNDNYPQLYIDDSSSGNINKVTVYNGGNSTGIYNLSDLPIKLSNIKTWGNIKGFKSNSMSYEIFNCNFEDNKEEGGCFITTAVLLTLGKKENCLELQTFRRYRDNWLINIKQGKKIIEEYYLIAPIIVNYINRREDSKEIFKNIWKKYLKKCYNFIKLGYYQKCLELYKNMVYSLKEKYVD